MSQTLFPPLMKDLLDAVQELPNLSNNFPTMVPTADIKDLLLGPTPLPAVFDAFHRRASYEHNQDLDVPEKTSNEKELEDDHNSADILSEVVEDDSEVGSTTGGPKKSRFGKLSMMVNVIFTY